MRARVTIADDVAALLRRIREKRKASFRDVLNEALRLGLQHMSTPPPPRRRYRTRSVSLGRCLVGSLDDVAEAVAEGDSYR